MRIALIVLWWLAVALTVMHFVLSKTPYSGKDFYIHGITSIVIFSVGPIGLQTKVPALYYGGFIALTMEWLWKLSFLSDLIQFGDGGGFSNGVFEVWIVTLLTITVILILGFILLFRTNSPLNLAKHLLSIPSGHFQTVRNTTAIALGLLGLFVFFCLKMQDFTFILQDWIKLSVFVSIVVLWIIGTASSRATLIFCSFYLSLGVFLFFLATTVSFTYSAFVMSFQFGMVNAIVTSYYQAFLLGAVYLLVGLPLFTRIVMVLSTKDVSSSQQLDQF